LGSVPQIIDYYFPKERFFEEMEKIAGNLSQPYFSTNYLE
jgi:hypothetical protein